MNVTKADLKNAAGIDTSKFSKTFDWAYWKPNSDKLDSNKLTYALTNLNNLKSNVDKLNVDKYVLVPADVSKLSDAVRTMLLKKMYKCYDQKYWR